MTRIAPSRLRLFAPFVLAPLWASAVAAPAKKAVDPTTPWQVAEAARAQLTQIPPAERTAVDYRTVMDAYRLIYHANPGDLHAPEAIYAVGNLLAEEGMVLHDTHALQEALGQYEFLRRQYPTSSSRKPTLPLPACTTRSLRAKSTATSFSSFLNRSACPKLARPWPS